MDKAKDKAENPADVYCDLKTILDDRKMSIRQLAEKSGLKFETVRRLYNDDTKQYQRHSIAAVCKTLNIDVADLLKLRVK